MNINKIGLLLLTVFAAVVFAERVDTVIVADGSPGPYRLGRFFVDTATIEVWRTDSGAVPLYRYVSSLNALLFSELIDSGTVLQVWFETDYYGLPKVFSLYEKRYTPPDTGATVANVDSLYRPRFSLRQENVTVSGYKTVGVAVGSFGQVDLSQGLDVRIGGEIRPGTEITAHLNDQGSSLEGSTREISDFDMIYIALTDPRFGVVAGDQYVEWPFAGILEGRKKIKGIAASVTPGKTKVKAFGALAGGNFTVQTWHGDGGQGPYNFTGNGEPGFITPIGGTVRVTVNGQPCTEGEEHDYVVDYEIGTMTFTARRLIRPEDIIRVEYEYKMFNYQRTLTGLTAGTAVGDSLLTVDGVLWSEIDNKNNPIELALTDENLNALKASGDRPPLDTADNEVNPNDVLTRYAAIPLYVKKDTLGAVIFVQRVPDPNRPDQSIRYYDVHFSEADDGCGDYVREISQKYPDYVYRYVGPCGGKYTPLTLLSAPQRYSSGEAKVALSLPLLKMTFNAAGQERDRNLFSSLDDGDNLASAARADFLAGKKDFKRSSVWLGGTGKFWSQRFDREALSAYERKSEWNDDRNATDGNSQRLVWESNAGVTPFAGLSTELLYGQQRGAGRLVTDKAGNRTKYYPLSWLHLDYAGTAFRHFEDAGTGTGHQQNASIALPFDKHAGLLSYRDEWRKEASGAGGGLMEGVVRYEFLPLQFTEEFGYTTFRKGSGTLFSAVDTANDILWKQSIDCSPFRWWRLAGSGAWQRRAVEAPQGRTRSTTLLIELNSTTRSENSSFTSEQHYRTTSEKASRFLQIPTYVGEGRGTHRWDSTMNEYVEDLHGGGDFIIQQRDVYDSTSDLRMRKTRMTVEWEYRPEEKHAGGIAGDLSWNGALYLEEHLDATIDRPFSWLPGYLSLRTGSGAETVTGRIRYSSLSYRQEIGWRPSFNRDLRGRLTLTPDYRLIRSYREGGLTGTLSIERRRPAVTLSSDVRFLAVSHDDTVTNFEQGDYYLHELSATFTQVKPLGNLFELSLRESGGWARQAATSLRTAGVRGDSTLFVQLTPGTALILGERGRAEASYTFSLVNLPREHDYRIAGGFSSGLSHLIMVMANVRVGKFFTLSASYRGEIFRKRKGEEAVEPPRHVVSMEMQALL
ncbi:MAG: hypothetical protein JW863_24100 [Chitinispirillaceae bacterium]|nr:hypothetical protein [Chitinispirillaceae bacterium]